MPGPTEIVRAAVELPLSVARFAWGLLPFGSDSDPDESVREGRVNDAPPTAYPEAREADWGPADPPESLVDDHVEVETELVAESADPEAVDGPGPEFHVDEPWDGYRRMKVAEIKTRLDGQPLEVLAAVELYEMTHRKRQGVLEAVRAASRT